MRLLARGAWSAREYGRPAFEVLGPDKERVLAPSPRADANQLVLCTAKQIIVKPQGLAAL